MSEDQAPVRGSVRRVLRTIVRLPLDYRVSLLVLLLPAIATALARWRLGEAPTAEEIDRLGYGWPAFEAGRWVDAANRGGGAPLAPQGWRMALLP